MDNDSIYSGISAHPAREVAHELHGRPWPGANDQFLDLVGAVTTLAREVDRITPRVVEHDSREPDGYMTATHRLRLLLLGLKELQDMMAYGQGRGAHQDTLTAAAVRLSALRAAHQAALDNPE